MLRILASRPRLIEQPTKTWTCYEHYVKDIPVEAPCPDCFRELEREFAATFANTK